MKTPPTPERWTPPQRHINAQATKPRQATASITSKPVRPATPKEKAFVQHIVHDKMTATDAYKEAYNTQTTRKAMHTEAHRTLRKPSVQLELSQYTDTAKLALVELIDVSSKYARLGGKDGASYASVLEKTANSVIDRVEGKAKQQVQIESKAVTINIDLTGVTTDTET